MPAEPQWAAAKYCTRKAGDASACAMRTMLSMSASLDMESGCECCPSTHCSSLSLVSLQPRGEGHRCGPFGSCQVGLRGVQAAVKLAALALQGQHPLLRLHGRVCRGVAGLVRGGGSVGARLSQGMSSSTCAESRYIYDAWTSCHTWKSECTLVTQRVNKQTCACASASACRVCSSAAFASESRSCFRSASAS